MKLLIALLLLLGGGAFLAGYAGTPGGPAARPTEPARAPALPTAPAGETVVEIEESALNAQIDQRLAGQPLGQTPFGEATLDRAEVRLRRGRVDAAGSARVGGATVPVTATGTIVAQSGRAVVALREATIAGLLLPAGTREQIERAVQGQVDAAVDRQGIRVTSVTILDGRVVVVGNRR